MIHVRQSTISQIETGERTPSLPMLIRIAAALGVTVNDLISEEALSEAVNA
jgi:transcriptional regulator with XRE-family HTH domain